MRAKTPIKKSLMMRSLRLLICIRRLCGDSQTGQSMVHTSAARQ